MVKSMTGYGRAQQTIDGYDISVEIKSVNHRYLDFNFRIPRHYSFLEEGLKNQLKAHISRGKIDVMLSIHKQQDDSKDVTVNTPLARNYLDALAVLSDELGIKNDITVSKLAQLGDVFEVSYIQADEQEVLNAALPVLGKAIEEFMRMREREGKRLSADMLIRNNYIRDTLLKIEEIEPGTVDKFRERLQQRIKDLIGENGIDDSRILTEAAIFADKISITEEITRLRSHLNSFEEILGSGEAIGRKLDFLLQEMNREVNTIGSKSNSLDISKIVVDIKSELEKNREQIQNIE